MTASSRVEGRFFRGCLRIGDHVWLPAANSQHGAWRDGYLPGEARSGDRRLPRQRHRGSSGAGRARRRCSCSLGVTLAANMCVAKMCGTAMLGDAVFVLHGGLSASSLCDASGVGIAAMLRQRFLRGPLAVRWHRHRQAATCLLRYARFKQRRWQVGRCAPSHAGCRSTLRCSRRMPLRTMAVVTPPELALTSSAAPSASSIDRRSRQACLEAPRRVRSRPRAWRFRIRPSTSLRHRDGEHTQHLLRGAHHLVADHGVVGFETAAFSSAESARWASASESLLGRESNSSREHAGRRVRNDESSTSEPRALGF